MVKIFVFVLLCLVVGTLQQNDLSDDDRRKLYERIRISFSSGSIKCDIPEEDSRSFLNNQCSVFLFFGKTRKLQVSGKSLYYRYKNIMVQRAYCECYCEATETHKLSLVSRKIWVRLWEFVGLILGLILLLVILIVVICCFCCCRRRNKKKDGSGEPLKSVNDKPTDPEKGEKKKPLLAAAPEKEKLITEVELRQKKQLNSSNHSNSDNEADGGIKSPRNPQYRYSEITSDI